MKIQKFKRTLAFICTSVILLTTGNTNVYAAADTEQAVTGEIEVISNVSEEIMQTYIDNFEKKYPGVTVEYHCYDNYEEKVSARFEEGDYADVLMVPSFLGADAYAQYLEPLGDYDELSEKYNYLEDGKLVNKVVYGIPSSAYVAGILYNKDVFYKAGITDTPKSTEEFIAALEAIKERTDAIPFYTNYSDAWALQSWETFPYIEMTGDSNYRNNTYVNELNPFRSGSTHYQVYCLLYDIVSNGLAGDTPMETNWEESKVMLNNGEIGCMVMGSWSITQFKHAGENSDSVAFMPFPNEINGEQYMTISTDYCYSISNKSENKEAARAYIDYMLDESGYALNQETLSIVKTDPYPDSYGDMQKAIVINSKVATSENYDKRQKLSANLNLEDTAETKRVIESAAGASEESFNDIMDDWNTRWESSRTADMQSSDDILRFAEDSVITDTYEVNYSKTEEDYLKEKKNLTIGYLKNMAPLQ